MNTRENEQLVRECDAYMESGLNKFLDGNLHGALPDLHKARAIIPHYAPALRCCAILSSMLGDKASASEYKLQANRNSGRSHSDSAENVYQDFWAEFMNHIICQPLVGSDIHIRLEEPLSLPSLPSCFQNNNMNSQRFISDLYFTPTIERYRL